MRLADIVAMTRQGRLTHDGRLHPCETMTREGGVSWLWQCKSNDIS